MQSLYNAAVWGVVRVPVGAGGERKCGEGKGVGGKVPVGISGNGKKKRLGKGGDEDEPGPAIFDEGKARLRLAMVFLMIGVACLTGAPLGGVLLDRGGRAGEFFSFFPNPVSPPLPPTHLRKILSCETLRHGSTR